MTKKFLILFTAVLISLTANAQFCVGGSLGFDYNNLKSESAKTYSLTVEPAIGYCITDRHSVELDFGYGMVSVKNTITNTSTTENVYYIDPTYCYSIPVWDELSYNIYAGIDLGFNDNGFSRYGAFACNYLEYFITSQWSVTAGFTILSVSRTKADDVYDTNVSFAWNNPGLNFGFYFYF